jgi:hypothetical protein
VLLTPPPSYTSSPAVAVVMFVATFTAPSDPTVDPNAWKCVALDDLQCQAVWAALAGGSPLPSTPPAHPSNMSATTWNTSDGQQASYCDLNPEQVEWVNPQLSLVSLNPLLLSPATVPALHMHYKPSCTSAMCVHVSTASMPLGCMRQPGQTSVV